MESEDVEGGSAGDGACGVLDTTHSVIENVVQGLKMGLT